MAAVEDPESIQLFGTGGQLLAGLKRLMGNLKELKSIKLTDLMLVRYDANHLLDEVLESCNMGLKRLHLINLTKVHCPIMHVGLFFNLKELVISPQNIDDDVLQLIADSKIRQLYLYQNRYTPDSLKILSCTENGWEVVKRDNPKLMVRQKTRFFPQKLKRNRHYRAVPSYGTNKGQRKFKNYHVQS
jgi:F-box protein 39